MKNAAAVSRYARAIFELAPESGGLQLLRTQLGQAAGFYSSSRALRSALHNPLIAYEARERIIRELCARAGLSTATVHTLLVLLRRRRLDILPHLVDELQKLSDEHSGVCRASVTSASSLSQTQLEKIQRALEASTGKRIVLEHKEDASLIGGLVTRVGGNLYDGSISGRLGRLEKSLLATD